MPSWYSRVWNSGVSDLKPVVFTLERLSAIVSIIVWLADKPVAIVSSAWFMKLLRGGTRLNYGAFDHSSLCQQRVKPLACAGLVFHHVSLQLVGAAIVDHFDHALCGIDIAVIEISLVQSAVGGL